MKLLRLLPITLLILFFSCNKAKNAEQNTTKTMEFEVYSYDIIAQDSTGSDAKESIWHIQGRGVLPIAIADADIQLLRDSLAKLTQVELPASGVANPILSQGFKALSDPNAKNETGNLKTNELFVVLNTDRVIVWQNYFEGYAYGAAHGIYSNSYVNYSIDLKKILSLSDLFVENYHDKLEALIREKLSDNESLLVDLNEVTIPGQFRITPSGIDFIFGVYEIAPYSAGEIVVKFYAYELQDLLTKQAFEMITGQSN